MLPLVIDFTNLLLSALLGGALFCTRLLLNPAGLNAARYVALQQNGIRTLHPVMPRLGALTIASTLAAAFFARNNGFRISLLLIATGCFIAAGLITRFRNMPINAIVIGWNADAPPEIWTRLRDAWWSWHTARLAVALTGLALVIVSTLARSMHPAPETIAVNFVFEAILRAAYLLV